MTSTGRRFASRQTGINADRSAAQMLNAKTIINAHGLKVKIATYSEKSFATMIFTIGTSPAESPIAQTPDKNPKKPLSIRKIFTTSELVPPSARKIPIICFLVSIETEMN